MATPEYFRELKQGEEEIGWGGCFKLAMILLSYAGIGFVVGYFATAIFIEDPLLLFSLSGIESMFGLCYLISQCFFSTLSGFVGGVLLQNGGGQY